MLGKTCPLLLVVLAAASRLLGQAPGGPSDASAPAGGADFFEARVRPVLAENCHGCHGPEKQKAGLRLDSRDDLIKGSSAGPVVVMGDPDRSPMILALRQRGEIKMPPKGKLPDEAIEALATWVRMGAPWPAKGAGGPTTSPEAAALDVTRSHWAFQPVRDPPAPPVAGSSWPSSPTDRFILARLEEKGIKPAPRADRRTLLRRTSYGLIGLPPEPEAVEAFAADESPDAFERAVDRLLASPRHGERWGRHWLDVARYADTKGYVFEEERRFPYAYTYRDYVIRAFNEDLPYDRFIVEQIAADLLPEREDKAHLAAMGFLTLGRRFLNNKHDIIDDRIDVVSRGLMALTVTCARCHDHKFDPIPSADYYSLYGVFASAVEPKDPPVIGTAEPSEAYAAFEKELKKLDGDVQAHLEARHGELVAEIRRRTADYLVAAAAPAPEPNAGRKARAKEDPKVRDLTAGELHPLVIARWRDRIAGASKAHDPVFASWVAFADLPADQFATRAAEVAARIAAGGEPAKAVNALVAKAFAGAPPASLKEVAERYGSLQGALEKTAGGTDVAREELRQALVGPGAPPSIPLAEVERYFDRAQRGKLRELRKKVDGLKATSPGAPPRAMSLAEAEPYDPVVFIRGNPGMPGKQVPRQFLEALSRDRKPFEQGSGRLELARAIASPQNPLTARVIVNRVWTQHLGAPLVATPGDFGVRSEPPVYPEILDHLASRLVEGGWSLKRLHRLILLSSAYQQAWVTSVENERVDPDNRLLWRANRHRLDFEALRDSLLAAAGSLDSRAGGPAVDITKPPFSTRRTVYAFIERQNLPGIFRTFDFANPDTTSPRRFATTVPQQALFLMNAPFAVEQAHRLAARPEVASKADVRDRVAELYRIALARRPEPDELELALAFLGKRAPEGAPLSRLDEFAQVLLLSNELAFVD